MGHVNNAVYFTYLETARTQFFFKRLKLSNLAQLPVILAEATCTGTSGPGLRASRESRHAGDRS
jgi:hypothetical protein